MRRGRTPRRAARRRRACRRMVRIASPRSAGDRNPVTISRSGARALPPNRMRERARGPRRRRAAARCGGWRRRAPRSARRASSTRLTTSSTTCSVLKPRSTRTSLPSRSRAEPLRVLDRLEAEEPLDSQRKNSAMTCSICWRTTVSSVLRRQRPHGDEDGAEAAAAGGPLLLLDRAHQGLLGHELAAHQDGAEGLAGRIGGGVDDPALAEYHDPFGPAARQGEGFRSSPPTRPCGGSPAR